MKHFSLTKLIAALCITNIFVFSCAVTGTVGDANIESVAEDNSVPDDTHTIGGTVDFIGDDDVPKEDNINNREETI